MAGLNKLQVQVFGRKTVSIPPYYNGVSAVYTLQRPPMTTLWTNVVLRLRRSSDDALAYVFFDGSGVGATITLSSLISFSSYTIPSATTLGTWLGSADAYVAVWFGITDDNTVDINKSVFRNTGTKQPKFATAGVIITKNGKPAIDFLNDLRYLTANAITPNPVLNSGNSFTVISVSALSTLNTIGIICSNSIDGTISNDSKFIHLNDSTASALHTNLRNTSGANYLSTLLGQENTTSQKLLTTTLNYPTALKSYYNGTAQQTVAVTGSWVNSTFLIGVQRNEATQFNGTIQELILFPSDKTADLSALHAYINSRYSIY